ncbi:MAG: bifunctional enoyl-CoA hydratase/phosphate acetyltransferase [Caldisericia bacterium]|nr:bifunctional enoyl-CoA hydratase/phosphate acetyltransferase [Caldisericia bacterium]
MITNFKEAYERAVQFPPRRTVIVAAGDKDVLEAVHMAKQAKLIEPILIDSRAKIESSAPSDFSLDTIEVIDESDKLTQCKLGLELIRNKQADILMKGLISTPVLFKEVLNKEYGIRKGKLLSHVGVIKSEKYPKFILMTDGGIVTDATLENKIEIIKNAVLVANALGIDMPKAALLSAIETVTPNIQSTIDAAIITKMCERGQLPGVICDGPLALDNAVSIESCHHKGIVSSVGGEMDIAVMPNIESGNIFYKVLLYLGGGLVETAGLVIGAMVPVVVPSRADTPENKYNSILIANLIANTGK